MSGANAKRGDIVRNLVTQRVGTMLNPSQFGRIIVKLNSGGTEKWERTSTEVLAERVS